MRQALEKIDPKWAWEAYSPSTQDPFTRQKAAHLFRRAGFGVNYSQLNESTNSTPVDLVNEFLSSKDLTGISEEIDQLAYTTVATGNTNNLSAWWLYRMLETSQQLLEKTTLFWHGHFATGAEKVKDVRLMYSQNQMLRTRAFGDFRTMVQEISKDPAMLIYLDSDTNRKAHPNENYAREVMELFCLGEGNYSEEDVLEVARTFTGWEIRRKKFHFNKYQHDKGEKSFLGKSGEFGGESAVDIIVDQPACSRFIARKLVSFFVFDQSNIPDSLVEPLAIHFQEHGHQIKPLIEKILTSNLFFSEWSYARNVRSPIELAIGLLRSIESKANVYDLQKQLKSLGQVLFYPPNVKGWEGGRNWINTSTLLSRANLVGKLVQNKKSRFGAGKLEELTESYGLSKPKEIVDWLIEVNFAKSIPSEIHHQLTGILQQKGDRSENIAYVIQTMSTLPEFQLV